MNHHLREIVDCLDEALRLQSRVMDLTEQVYEAAGISPGDRTLRGKVTGLFFGLQAHLEELNRLAQDAPEAAAAAAKPQWVHRGGPGWIAIC